MGMYKEIRIDKDFLSFEFLGRMQKKKNTLTVSSFRDQIKTLKFDEFYQALGGKTSMNEDLENAMLPAIVHTYYSLLVILGRVPTIEEVCKSYTDSYTENAEEDGKLRLKKDYRTNKSTKELVFTVNELHARICRAYNSYHREVDLLLQLIEAYGDEYNFYYSFEEDYWQGVDIVATSKSGQRYDIATYFSSRRSKNFKKAKNTTRHEYKNINIDVIACFEGQSKNVVTVGDARLYNNLAVKQVYAELTKERVA